MACESRLEAKNEWSCAYVPSYVVMVCTGTVLLFRRVRLREMTVRFVMSVCLSVMKRLGSLCMDFYELSSSKPTFTAPVPALTLQCVNDQRQSQSL